MTNLTPTPTPRLRFANGVEDLLVLEVLEFLEDDGHGRSLGSVLGSLFRAERSGELVETVNSNDGLGFWSSGGVAWWEGWFV